MFISTILGDYDYLTGNYMFVRIFLHVNFLNQTNWNNKGKNLFNIFVFPLSGSVFLISVS